MGGIIAGVVGVALVVVVLVRLFGRRGSMPYNRELAMTVWAAVGPHESAEAAELALSLSVRAVFGESGLSAHASWIRAHADNFRRWEESGTLKENTEFMCRGLAASAAGPDFEAARAKFDEESKIEALRLLDEITADLGKESAVPAMRALIDVSMPPRQIQEELEASQKENAARIVRVVGENLLRATSQEAVRVRQFLEELSREQNSEAPTTPEACGLLYLNCVNYAVSNPDSEFARVFNSIDDQWKAAFANEQEARS